MIAKKRRKTLALATLVGAAGFSTAGVALAGVTPTSGTMNVHPETVEPGGTYVISNDPASPCPLGEVTGDTGGIRPGAWKATMEPDGDWSVPIEVPANGPPDAMGNPTPFPEGEYEQHAFCHEPLDAGSTSQAAAAGEQQEGFTYDPVTVTVQAEDEGGVAPEQEEPPAAEPAAEAPDFTG